MRMKSAARFEAAVARLLERHGWRAARRKVRRPANFEIIGKETKGNAVAEEVMYTLCCSVVRWWRESGWTRVFVGKSGGSCWHRGWLELGELDDQCFHDYKPRTHK